VNSGRQIIQIGVALLLAVVAGFLAMRWMNAVTPEKAPQAVVQPATVPVVVAARILTPGTKLSAQMLKVAPYLKESVPDQAFTSVAELEGRILISPLSVGEAVIPGKLASDAIAAGGVSALINEGRRAMSVKGNKVMGLAGFVKPGNRVDVLVTLDTDGHKNDRPITKIVLENVPVLATGEKLESDEDGKLAPVDVYTLEVTPVEGERLALAATKGTLNFALRGALDNATVQTDGMDIPRALTAFAPPRPVQKRPDTKRIELIVGGKRTVELF